MGGGTQGLLEPVEFRKEMVTVVVVAVGSLTI